MRVACVILNYNDSIRTKKLVEKIIYFKNIDIIIVVDNNSNDDSLNRLKSINCDKYKLIESSKNGGYGAGNNLGLEYANLIGIDYVIIANPDVNFSELCIDQLIKTMKKNPNCAILSAKETKLGVSGWKYTSSLHDVLSASLILNKLLKSRYYAKEYFESGDVVKVDIVPGCFLMVDLEKIILIDKYDEDFFLYEEEKILCKKTIDKGFDSLIDTSVSFEHNHGIDKHINIKRMLIGKKRLLQSKYLYLKKYRKFNSLLLLASNVFFLCTYIEMFIYAILLKIKFIIKE